MGSEFWNSKQVAEGWSNEVGENGDFYQQRILKPFVVSCLLTNARELRGLPVVFPRMHRDLTRNEVEHPAQVADWHTLIQKHCRKEQGIPFDVLDLTKILVVDLGCGEGFMLRFLSEFGATCIGLDGSDELIRRAKQKAQKSDRQPAIKLKKLSFDDTIPRLIDIVESELPKEQSFDDFKHLVVLSLNVFDHLEYPRQCLEGIQDLTQIFPGRSTIIASTLNPKYFDLYGPLRRSAFATELNSQTGTIHFPWTSDLCDYFRRDWSMYEQLFDSTDFATDYVHFSGLEAFAAFNSSGKIELPKEISFPNETKLSLVDGPFLLWRLYPKPPSTKVTKEELDGLVNDNELPSLPSLSSNAIELLKSQHDKLKIVEFSENEIVGASGERCPGIFFVLEGSFEVSAGVGATQYVSKGQQFGDLESVGGFYSSRYLYEVRAGRRGGKCLLLPSSLLNKILLGELCDSGQSIGDTLFVSMRRSFNIYTPFYHGSHEVQPTNNKEDTRIKKLRLLTGNSAQKRVSPRGLEHCARSLITLAAIDEDRFQVHDGFPNLSFLIHQRQLNNWLTVKPRDTDKAFRRELEILHDIGVVDSFSFKQLWSKESIATEQEALTRDIVETGISEIIGRRFTKITGVELADTHLDQIVDRQTRDVLASVRGESPIVGPMRKELRIDLKRTLTEFVRKSQTAMQRVSQLVGAFNTFELVNDLVKDYYLNIAFLHYAFLNRDERSFLVIRDFPFIRRFAAGGDKWLHEIAARFELYEHVLDRRLVETRRGSTVDLQWEEPDFRDERAINYFREFKSFVFGHWKEGLDVDLCGPHRSELSTSWRPFIQ